MSETSPIVRTALVTGGGRGIGREYVIRLRENGFKVVFLDVAGVTESLAEIDATKKEGQQEVIGLTCDVGNREQLIASLEEAYTLLGGYLDVLVNNAGIIGSMFDRMEKIIEVNLFHAMRTTEYVIKRSTDALKHPAPRPIVIVNTASSNGLVPAESDMMMGYVSSKFALVGFTASLAWTKAYNIRVASLCPVTVATPMVEPLLDDSVRAFLDAEGRGGVMPASWCANAMMRVIEDESIHATILPVHPAAGPDGYRVEPSAADPAGHFAYLGEWRADKSPAVKEYVQMTLDAVRDEQVNGWSS